MSTQIFCKVQNFFFREKKIIIVIKSICINSYNRCFQAELRLLQKEFRNSVKYSQRNRVIHDNDNDYTTDLVIR